MDYLAMVTHVSYLEARYDDASSCLLDMRERLELGWSVSQVRGGRKGPFAVIYRKDDADGQASPAR